MRPIKVTVAGQAEEADLASELTLTDPEAQRAGVAAKIAWWGSIVAAAKRQLDELEAEKKHWSGGFMVKIINEGAGADWKAKAALASQDQILVFDRRLAALREELGKAESILSAFQASDETLRAMVYKEARAAGFVSELGRKIDARYAAVVKARREQQQPDEGKPTGE